MEKLYYPLAFGRFPTQNFAQNLKKNYVQGLALL